MDKTKNKDKIILLSMKLTTEDIRRELLDKIAEEKARGYQAETILDGIELYLKFRNDEV